MGKVAFVFPGQGAQKVGMGKAAYEASPEAKLAFDEADRTLGGEPLSKLCFEGPEASLMLTTNTQPAVLATSIALLRGLGERCDFVAGHSLGEYSAHVCAGTFAFGDALGVVRTRGALMQDAVPVGQGAMAAVMGLDRAAVERVCTEVASGVCEPVNYNSAQQIVIAGSAPAIAEAREKIKAAGGKAIALPVSAPFHSSLMRPAEDRLAPHLGAIAFRDPSVPVYANVDAEPVTTAAAAKEKLLKQVSRAVRWEESVQRMAQDGASLFVEIGPGKVLTGLIARIAPDVARVNVQTPEDFAPAREAIAKAR